MAILKQIVVVSVVSTAALLVVACSGDVEDACEHLNELCANQSQGGLTIRAQDCSQANDRYEALSDADKEKADKQADCINDAEDCATALKCALSGGTVTPGTSTSSSSGDPFTPPAECDDSKCLPGNQCLPLALPGLDPVTECRKTCSSNDDPSTSCPFNYNCVSTDPDNGVPPFCVATTALTNDGNKIERKESGQWGWPCQANEGSKNPACDLQQGFYCYGTSPTDGNAYCTRYDCLSDLECGAGFACVDINTTPNVATSKKKAIGATQKVCLRRTYCSPCNADVDCTTIEGTKQHCITDSVGRGFCTPECTTNQNCNNEAKCVTVRFSDESTGKVCYPRSKACIGDGKLCSSCLVDTDCGEGGVCTHGQYTTEKFCITPAPGGDCAQCPKELTTPARRIGCSSKDDDLYPANYCIGLYSIGGTVGSDIGCWTPDR